MAWKIWGALDGLVSHFVGIHIQVQANQMGAFHTSLSSWLLSELMTCDLDCCQWTEIEGMMNPS